MVQWKQADRFKIEADYFNKQAALFLRSIREDDLIMDSEKFPFPNMQSIDFTSYALSRLGDIKGKRLLDCGCGTGESTVYFAQQGADVTGIDIAEGNIKLCHMRAKANNVGASIQFIAKPVELLDFEDRYFDLIFGAHILHHLDREIGFANIQRMLNPEGKAVFCEPALLVSKTIRNMRYSKFGRKLLPYYFETPTESSLSKEDLELLKDFFELEYQEFHLLARITNWFKINHNIYRKITALDEFLLRHVALLRSLCHYIVLILKINRTN